MSAAAFERPRRRSSTLTHRLLCAHGHTAHPLPTGNLCALHVLKLVTARIATHQRPLLWTRNGVDNDFLLVLDESDSMIGIESFGHGLRLFGGAAADNVKLLV